MLNPIIHWNFDPVLFSVGPLHVQWYGLIWAGAFLGGQQFLNHVYRREQCAVGESDHLLLYALIGTVAGARLAHCLIYDPVFYLTHPVEILKVWKGGLASHGGATGMFLALWLYTRRHAVPSYLWLLDRLAIPAAVGAALIRIANFLGSQIVGVPTSGSWGVVFEAVDAVPRHPVQLYESAAYLAISAMLFAVYRRSGERTPHGLLVGMLLTCVFVARFVLEFFKMPQAAYEAGFSVTVGQWLSVPFALVGAGLVLWSVAASGRRLS